MRFLKNKIARAHEFSLRKSSLPKKEPFIIRKHHHSDNKNAHFEETTSSSDFSEAHSPYSPSQLKSQRLRSSDNFVTPIKTRATKSVVKNYGKAICSFACSELAKLYLEPMIKNEDVDYGEFTRFMAGAKDSIDSLHSFQALLLITENDDKRTKAFKKIFAEIGEVFIKYFSVNWIFSGKVVHKEAHLKSRFKMIRRLRNPPLFTYLK